MQLSESARVLRNEMRDARLKAKKKAAKDGDHTAYSNFYSGQGLQVAKSEHNAKITQARQLVRTTREAAKTAQKVTGVGIPEALVEFATAQATLTALTKQKQDLFGTASAFGLSGGEA